MIEQQGQKIKNFFLFKEKVRYLGLHIRPDSLKKGNRFSVVIED
jgi:hypothetical protein